MIVIDGSRGEGGGQVLRTALSLSLATGIPFRIEAIRAGRQRPGLMRQHLACVRAAAMISGARVEGDTPGSTALAFTPGAVVPGEHAVAVGSAGSTLLVLQTVLMPLALAGGRSRLRLEGGTHNSLAPPFEAVAEAFLPLVRRIGLDVTATLERPGFQPAGGGVVTVEIGSPGRLEPLVLEARGALVSRRAEAVVAHLTSEVGRREVRELRRRLDWDEGEIRLRPEQSSDGPGNIVLAVVAHQAVTEVFSAVGQRGVPAEAVAADVADAVTGYLASGVAVGPHLADQLLLPLALARGGRFVTGEPTAHATTNMDVIEAFLGRDRFDAVALGDGRWQVEVEGAPAMVAQ